MLRLFFGGCLLVGLSQVALADEGLVASRSLPAGTVIAASDLRPASGESAPPDALAGLIGLATRRTIYMGQPVTMGDLSPPLVVRRNDLVTMRFLSGKLEIRAEGRALGEGAVGDRIRVLNLESRIPVTARVSGPSSVEVR